MLVDVIINVYGKPWQTLCTLTSLMRNSGQHIDKIYFIEEREQPFNSEIDWVSKEFENIIKYTPYKRVFQVVMEEIEHPIINSSRYVVPYQFGIEQSDKQFVFVCHNDVLFNNDLVGNLLEQIGDSAGIGDIGMCHNCPCGPTNADVCNGERFNNFAPTYEQVMQFCDQFEPTRKDHFFGLLNKDQVMPIPECRLNEYACLINREITVRECYPEGSSPLFGTSSMDIGCGWFRSLYLKGYKFKYYDINTDMIHGFYAGTAGYPVQQDYEKYMAAEDFARLYFQERLS